MANIRNLYNQPTVLVVVPEAGAAEQLTLWEKTPDSSEGIPRITIGSRIAEQVKHVTHR